MSGRELSKRFMKRFTKANFPCSKGQQIVVHHRNPGHEEIEYMSCGKLKELYDASLLLEIAETLTFSPDNASGSVANVGILGIGYDDIIEAWVKMEDTRDIALLNFLYRGAPVELIQRIIEDKNEED